MSCFGETGDIEEGLTSTQEVNVNLQVLLERAVSKQKENDVNATRAMRHIHSNLAAVSWGGNRVVCK